MFKTLFLPVGYCHIGDLIYLKAWNGGVRGNIYTNFKPVENRLVLYEPLAEIWSQLDVSPWLLS